MKNKNLNKAVRILSWILIFGLFFELYKFFRKKVHIQQATNTIEELKESSYLKVQSKRTGKAYLLCTKRGNVKIQNPISYQQFKTFRALGMETRGFYAKKERQTTVNL